MIKNLSEFISREHLKKAVEGVLITPDKIVASDSFKLIEIESGDTGVKKPIVLKVARYINRFEKVVVMDGEHFVKDGDSFHKGKLVEEKFPDYEVLIPKSEPVFTIKLSPLHLKEICTAFEDKVYIKMEFHSESKPVVFTENTGSLRALLMPINPDTK